jgi:hypothetical protein
MHTMRSARQGKNAAGKNANRHANFDPLLIAEKAFLDDNARLPGWD